METRVAVISIIVENAESVVRLNELLHEYGEYIIGRMAYRTAANGINIISVAIDAASGQDKLSYRTYRKARRYLSQSRVLQAELTK